jgi:hypothetical protein
MATSAERMRALWERAWRGIRRDGRRQLDDLRTPAERGYEGAASTTEQAHGSVQ